jgi:hypothetical protein
MIIIAIFFIQVSGASIDRNFYPNTLCLFLDILQVAAPVLVALENSHRADTPLGEVVWITDSDYSR